MNKFHYQLLPLIIAGLCTYGSSVMAEESNTRIDAELEFGVESDSRLSVEELDRIANQSDEAILAKAKLNGQWKPKEKITLKGGYSYSGVNYRNNSEFDIAIHQLFVDGSYNFDLATVGASHFFADAQLDNDDLLTLNRSSLYLSKLIDKRIFVRVAMDLTDKEFDGRPERDADTTGVSGDVYFFFNKAKTYISLGLSRDDEEANGPQFDYQGIGFKAKASNKFQLAGKDSKLSLEYRYKDRDYDNIHPQLGAERADTRQTTELAWEFWFNDNLALINALKYGNYNSNLDSANYSETLASIAFRLKL